MQMVPRHILNRTQKSIIGLSHGDEYATYAVVTCEIKLFWNNFDIISVYYFARK